MEIISVKTRTGKKGMPAIYGKIGNIKPKFLSQEIIDLENRKRHEYEHVKENIRREKVKTARYGNDRQLLMLLSRDPNTQIRHRVAINKIHLKKSY